MLFNGTNIYRVAQPWRKIVESKAIETGIILLENQVAADFFG